MPDPAQGRLYPAGRPYPRASVDHGLVGHSLRSRHDQDRAAHVPLHAHRRVLRLQRGRAALPFHSLPRSLRRDGEGRRALVRSRRPMQRPEFYGPRHLHPGNSLAPPPRPLAARQGQASLHARGALRLPPKQHGTILFRSRPPTGTTIASTPPTSSSRKNSGPSPSSAGAAPIGTSTWTKSSTRP